MTSRVIGHAHPRAGLTAPLHQGLGRVPCLGGPHPSHRLPDVVVDRKTAVGSYRLSGAMPPVAGRPVDSPPTPMQLTEPSRRPRIVSAGGLPLSSMPPGRSPGPEGTSVPLGAALLVVQGQGRAVRARTQTGRTAVSNSGRRPFICRHGRHIIGVQGRTPRGPVVPRKASSRPAKEADPRISRP
jgi:hypothetical protein